MMTMKDGNEECVCFDEALAEEKPEENRDHLAYLEAGHENAGRFGGRIAELWGLAGKRVTRAMWHQLCDGCDPISGQRLVSKKTHRKEDNTDKERIPFFDGTFSPPKSVSVAALVGGDTRLIDLHRYAVKVAMKEFEKAAMAQRGRRKDETFTRYNEATENMLWAEFMHLSDRDVDGYPCPQLHTHVAIFNLTKGSEGRKGKEYFSLNARELRRALGKAGAVYQAEMARGALALGYEVERREPVNPELMQRLTRADEKKFELKGYSDEYLIGQSLRSGQIKGWLKNNGLEYTAANAQRAAYATRAAKDIRHVETETLWKLHDLELGGEAAGPVQAALARGPLRMTKQVTAEEAFDYALDALLERTSIAKENDIIRKALYYGLEHGAVTADVLRGIAAERYQRGKIIGVRLGDHNYYTTQAMVNMERETLAAVAKGKDRFEAVPLPKSRKIEDLELSKAQWKSQAAVLQCPDQIQAIQGIAGAGKSTTLKSIKAAYEAAGYSTEFYAPTGQSREKLEDIDPEAKTLQAFLATMAVPTKETGPAGRVIVVDEASLVGTLDMHKLTQALTSRDRLLLVGDTEQHGSVSAGAPFRAMQQHGMHTAKLNEIRRQENEKLKEIIKHLQAGDPEKLRDLRGIQFKDGRPALVETAHRDQLDQAFVEMFAEKPTQTQGYCITNNTRRRLNDLVHSKLKEEGRLTGPGITVQILVDRALEKELKRNATAYDKGDVLQFLGEVDQFSQGQYARVIGRDDRDRSLILTTDNKNRIKWNPQTRGLWSVYRVENRDYMAGEFIQFTERRDVAAKRWFGLKTETVRIERRKTGRIETIDPEKRTVTVRVGRNICKLSLKEMAHTDYGYVMTSLSAQSATVPHALTYDEGHNVYVQLSRGAKTSTLFTPGLENLIDAMKAEPERVTALDAIQKGRAIQTKEEQEKAQLQKIAAKRLCQEERETRDRDELRAFKMDINLCEYACREHGFSVVKSKSTKSSKTLSHPDGSKLVVRRDESGRWMYFDPGDRGNNGTILDFVRNRTGGTLGQARKTLRPFLTSQPAGPSAAPEGQEYAVKPATKTEAAFQARWEEAGPIRNFSYWSKRGLTKADADTCEVRQDRRGNLLFPHVGPDGLTGYEIKNQGFTGFAAEGNKGLFFAHQARQVESIFITESALDAVSLVKQLHPETKETALVVSTGGAFGRQQQELIAKLANVNPDAEIVAAFDNDAGGERFAQQLRQMLTDAGLPNEYDRLTPTRKDWNEDWLALLTAARREQTEAERRPDADLVTTPMPRPTTVTTSPAPPAGPSQRPATASPMPTAPTPPAQPDYEEDYGLDL